MKPGTRVKYKEYFGTVEDLVQDERGTTAFIYWDADIALPTEFVSDNFVNGPSIHELEVKTDSGWMTIYELDQEWEERNVTHPQ